MPYTLSWIRSHASEVLCFDLDTQSEGWLIKKTTSLMAQGCQVLLIVQYSQQDLTSGPGKAFMQLLQHCLKHKATLQCKVVWMGQNPPANIYAMLKTIAPDTPAQALTEEAALEKIAALYAPAGATPE